MVRLVTGGQRDLFIHPDLLKAGKTKKKKSHRKKKGKSKSQRLNEYIEKKKDIENKREINRASYYKKLKHNENNMYATKIKIVKGEQIEERYKIQKLSPEELGKLMLVIIEDKKEFPLGGILKSFDFIFDEKESIKIIYIKDNRAYMHRCECPNNIENDVAALFKGRIF